MIFSLVKFTLDAIYPFACKFPESEKSANVSIEIEEKKIIIYIRTYVWMKFSSNNLCKVG